MIDKILKLLRTKKQFILEGPPGCGKTYATELVAKKLECKYLYFQLTPGMKFDRLVEVLRPDEDTKSGFRKVPGILVEAAMASQEGGVVLCLDEWDKTQPSADATLLDFLQSGRIRFSEETIQADMKNLVVFLTSNKVREFADTLVRRVGYLTFGPMPKGFVREQLQLSNLKAENIDFLMGIYEYCLRFPRDIKKAATLQELRELGETLEGETFSETERLELVKILVLKYDEDYKGWLSHYRATRPMAELPELEGNHRLVIVYDEFYDDRYAETQAECLKFIKDALGCAIDPVTKRPLFEFDGQKFSYVTVVGNKIVHTGLEFAMYKGKNDQFLVTVDWSNNDPNALGIVGKILNFSRHGKVFGAVPYLDEDLVRDMKKAQEEGLCSFKNGNLLLSGLRAGDFPTAGLDTTGMQSYVGFSSVIDY